MKRTFIRVLGLCLFLGGVISALLFRAVPPPSEVFWTVPGILICSGCYLSLPWRKTLRLAAGSLFSMTLVLGLALPQHAQNEKMPSTEIGLHRVQLQVPPQLRKGVLSKPRDLEVFEGLQVSVFAGGLDGPRMLAFGNGGELYVSTPANGQVLVLPDRNRDGVADRIQVFRGGMDRPHGLAFTPHGLVVAENGRLSRLVDSDRDLVAERIEVISTDIPGGGGHWTRSVLVGRDGAFYVSAGSSCNVCEEDDPRRAAILRIAAEGGSAQIYASGLRNSVGLALHPETGELWASNNGRDRLGDDLPPEEVNRIQAGGDYGWPYCYGQKIPDPDLGSVDRCRETLAPEVEMQAHSAPLGIAFGAGLDLPEPLSGMLYVAFHGSWNRSIPTGYKLVGVPFVDGLPSGPPRDILRGWLKGYSAWGRPVAPAVGPDGALYLSDDRVGAIYRISRAER